jgi:hypothetical protein
MPLLAKGFLSNYINDLKIIQDIPFQPVGLQLDRFAAIAH